MVVWNNEADTKMLLAIIKCSATSFTSDEIVEELQKTLDPDQEINKKAISNRVTRLRAMIRDTDGQSPGSSTSTPKKTPSKDTPSKGAAKNATPTKRGGKSKKDAAEKALPHDDFFDDDEEDVKPFVGNGGKVTPKKGSVGPPKSPAKSGFTPINKKEVKEEDLGEGMLELLTPPSKKRKMD